MKIGFVSAILAELSLVEVFEFARHAGFASIELMCWPPGKASRRYAGVTHLDVSDFREGDAAKVRDLSAEHGVEISGLGYYPNPLSPDAEESALAVAHLHKLIDASADLGVNTVTTFVGRDPSLSIEENWSRFLGVWRPVVQHAEDRKVRIGIENCPMLFGRDEWPGGKNLATTPDIWKRMFEDLPSKSFGLNYDPSHLVLQHIDHVAPIGEFKDRLVHVHAKDARINRASLDRHGVFSYPNLWHTAKLPGLGDVRWAALFSALTDAGYDGHVAIEVEDRAFEGTIEKRKGALILSRRFLLQFIIR